MAPPVRTSAAHAGLLGFIGRALIFLAIVGCLQGAAGKLWRPRLGVVSSTLGPIDEVESADIVLLGDSVLRARSAGESESKTLAEVSRKELSPRSVITISSPAFQSRVYQAIVEYLVRVRSRIGHLVVPVNLRSFGPLWSRLQSYQFEREIMALESGVGLEGSFLRWRWAFKQVPPVTPDLPRDAMLQLAGFPALRWRFPALRQPEPPVSHPYFVDFLREAYLTALPRDHPYLKALVSLCRTARDAGIPVLVYVTPIDRDEGLFHLGSRFRGGVETNVQAVRLAVAPAGCVLADWSLDFDSGAFMWREEGDRVNEHLNFEGRARLARLLRARLASGS
jgi:hypothetical protein